MEKKLMEFTGEVEKEIRDYLAKRFCSYGIESYKFEIDDYLEKHQMCEMNQEINKKYLGIFRHALSKCYFNVKLCFYNDNILVQTGLKYKHIGSGDSNDCDLEVEFRINKQLDIGEIYK